MAEWIRLGGEWGRSRIGVLDGVVIVEGEGAVFGVNVEHPIVTNGILCEGRQRGSSQIILGFLVTP